MSKLYELTGDIKTLQTMLEESVELPLEAITDTLEGIEMAFSDKAVNIVKLARSIDSDIEGVDSEIKRLQERKKTLSNSKTALLDYLRYNMESTNLTTIKDALFNITLAKGRPVLNVLDESNIPDEFITIKTDIKPDKRAILAALKDGQEVAGCAIGAGESSLRIK